MNKFFFKLIIAAVLLLTVSIKGNGMIKIIGSLEWLPPIPNHKYEPWTKVKQDLMNRKGLSWLLSRYGQAHAFILNNDRECGLFIYGQDSLAIVEIKNSLDQLSESNETVVVQYAYPDYEVSPEGPLRAFNSQKYKSDIAFRNFTDSVISDERSHFIKVIDIIKVIDRRKRDKKYWFLSDSTLYHDARCTSLFTNVSINNVIILRSVVDEYLAECRSLGYEPILYGKSKTLPSWISEEGADSRQEMQLLYKYIKKNDSIILNTPLPKDIYDINFVYDHTKTENVPPTIIGKKPLKEVYKPDLTQLTSFLNSSKICKFLPFIVPAIAGDRLINSIVIDYCLVNHLITIFDFSESLSLSSEAVKECSSRAQC